MRWLTGSGTRLLEGTHVPLAVEPSWTSPTGIVVATHRAPAGAPQRTTSTQPPTTEESVVRLVITQNITLDGVVEVNEDIGDWFAPADAGAGTADLDDTLRQTTSEEDARLDGRVTFASGLVLLRYRPL